MFVLSCCGCALKGSASLYFSTTLTPLFVYFWAVFFGNCARLELPLRKVTNHISDFGASGRSLAFLSLVWPRNKYGKEKEFYTNIITNLEYITTPYEYPVFVLGFNPFTPLSIFQIGLGLDHNASYGERQ